MFSNFRRFQVTDPFDRQWDVEFRWLQNAISIRHSDSVDVKFWLHHAEEKLERVIALMHKDLLRLSKEMDRPLSDAWCLKLGALHLAHMVTTWEDMEKTLVTPSYEDLKRHHLELKQAEELASAEA
jgi:hypothetical protein